MLDTTDFDPAHYVLIIKCPDTRGIVAAVSGYLNDNDISIVESNQFNDALGDMFYVRVVFRQAGPKMPPMATLRDGFKPSAHRFSMDWEIHSLANKPRVLIAVSKFGHCLNELLYRWRSGLLPVEIVAVLLLAAMVGAVMLGKTVHEKPSTGQRSTRADAKTKNLKSFSNE